VATRVGGTPDIVVSDVLGELVPPKDPEALARALGRALGTPYDAAAVSLALSAPDWEGSARALYGSLVLACEHRQRKVA
jgi:glycosyltransferase involved in cell wall biosynthesis